MADTEVRDDAVEHVVQDAFTRALTNFKGTFSFERKVNLGNYESVTATMFVQFDYTPGAVVDDFVAAAKDAAAKAKAVVYDELGIETQADEGGTIREIVNAFPGAVVEETPRSSAPSIAATSSKPPYSEDEVKAMTRGSEELRDAQRQNKRWLQGRLASNPNEFNDNRAKKAAGEWAQNSPDYTHRSSRLGLWDN